MVSTDTDMLRTAEVERSISLGRIIALIGIVRR